MTAKVLGCFSVRSAFSFHCCSCRDSSRNVLGDDDEEEEEEEENNKKRMMMMKMMMLMLMRCRCDGFASRGRGCGGACCMLVFRFTKSCS